MNRLDFQKKAEKISEQIVELRRKIHANPELGGQEFETAQLIARELEQLGLKVETEVGGTTGVVGLLQGNKPGPTIALRADMDALPIQEQTGLSYASQNEGVMHACGHDAHVAMLLGAAKLLAEIEELPGNIKFIFQPQEEQPPGGAKGMIAEGVLAEPEVNAIAALHVAPDLPVGTVAMKKGPIMAAADKFKVKVIGQGGHGAAPHQTVDSVVVTTHVIQALQTIVSRQSNPVEAAVLSIGELNGGSSFNVIAEEVTFSGTVRTLNSELRKRIPELMERTIAGTTDSFGADYKFDYEYGYPMLNNDAMMVEYFQEACEQAVGKASIIELADPSMGGEDFAYYAQQVPGVFAKLGTSKTAETSYPWHHPKFNLDEEALPIGSAVLTQLAYNYLIKKG